MQRQGSTLSRCVDMFVLPAAVISAGTGEKFDPSLEILDAEMPLLQQYWRELLYLRPSLEADLQGLNAQGYMDVSNAFLRERGQTNADDSVSISFALVDWLAAELEAANVQLKQSTRADRGFNNVVTGRYLCPVSLDYGDNAVKEALLRGHLASPADGLPSFLFDLEKYDPAAPWESFLRGPLIVLAWNHIFDHPSCRERAYKKSLVYISVAKAHGMVEVTPGSIIYAATMVHFALSTASSIYQKHLEIRALHHELVIFFNDPAFWDEVEALLRWWNRIAFPTYESQAIP